MFVMPRRRAADTGITQNLQHLPYPGRGTRRDVYASKSHSEHLAFAVVLGLP